ncbi:MAG: tetratricopeptide repeat protein [Cyanobacteria bacterium P01_A01_bin.83]
MGIQGLGGVGKSTLASYFYHSLNFEAKFWADVSLKPDFTVFAEKIIIALGGKVNYPLDITQLINNLLQLLSQRRCLLVVDNLETLLDTERNWQDENYQQFFSRWKQQGTNSTLVITTQDKPQLFQGLQHWYALGGMKLEEGISLLNKLAIQGTEDELKAFVEYVDGHPLTLKLVAGFLREYYDSQLSQIEELDLEKFDLTCEQAKGLHRNKQDARLSWIIQQHLDRLSLEQTQFMIGLSVYRVPFNREAASYMLVDREVKPIIIQKKLQELCARSLLIKTEKLNFQFESLVRKHIQKLTIDFTNAHEQAIKYYQTNLKEEKYWQVLEDVREYLETVYHRCELRKYTLANNVLDVCLNFLNLRGYYAVLVEVYEPLTQGWQACLQEGDRYNYAWALNNLGNAYKSLGEYQRAINFHQQSLAIAQPIGDRNGEAASLMGLGNAYYSLGEYQRAINFYQQSLAIKQQIGDRNGEAASLMGLGIAYDSLGEYQRAIDFHQQSLAIKQQIGDRIGEANSLLNLGNAYSYLGEYQKAIDFYQQSLAITQQIGARREESYILTGLGNAYSSLGKYQRAIEFHQQSLTITQQIGDRNGEGASLMGLGNAYSYLGEYQQAIDWLTDKTSKTLVIS